jgi:hypothetical protein
MEFLVITIVNIIWILYSMSEGVREAFFDYYQGLNKRRCSFNIKRMFLIQRALFLTLSTIIMSYSLGLLSIPIALGQICMFKYFHKISYVLSSKKLNSEVSEQGEEFTIFKMMNKHKNSLLFFGISLQIFIYIFIV